MRSIERNLWPVLLLVCVAQSRPAARVPATQPAEDPYGQTADAFFQRPEVKARIKKDAVDVALLEAAIFHQTNRERTANNLPIFKHGFAMNLMARRHSQEMADLQFFDHTSPTPANRTLSDRLRNVGLINVNAGENIAVLPAKEMGSGHYLIHDNPDGTETWTDEATGKVIDYYTYEELSAAVVKQWMNSPPHHANIVDRRFVYLGVGVARGAYGEMKQDSFYMTQNFCGSVTPGSEAKATAEVNPVGKTK